MNKEVLRVVGSNAVVNSAVSFVGTLFFGDSKNAYANAAGVAAGTIVRDLVKFYGGSK